MPTSRRTFLQHASLLAAGAGMQQFIPGGAIAHAYRKPMAADKLRVGVIGVNGMGWSNMNAMLKANPEVLCTAICDVDPSVLRKRMGELEKNFSQKAQSYADYRKLLADKNVDAVIIGTPDHWHCLQTVEACAAGKHVYVEKPVANSIAECRVMLAAQKRYGTIIQVGQWQRSNAHFKSALEYLRTGNLGRIRMVKTWAYQGWMTNIPVKPDGTPPPGVDYDMWLGPARKRPFNPNRFHFNFRWFWDYAGGLMTDWGVHLVDYALLGMNASNPISVMATGGKMAYPDDAAETPDTLATVYQYPDFIMLWEHAQAISNGNYGRDHGIAYIGNNGTLVLDRGGWVILTEGKKMEQVAETKRSDDGLAMHTRNFVEAVKTGNGKILQAPLEAGVNVAQVCQMGNIAYKTGRKIYWDQSSASFKDPDADKWITPEYHNQYQLPKF